jgi:hypothetical protein
MHPHAHALRRRAYATAVVALVLAGAAVASWLSVSHSTAAAPARPAQSGAIAAQRIALQPETGDFEMPSPAQMQAMGAGTAPRAKGDQAVRTRPDGGQYVDVHGRYLNYAVARRTADGKLERGCCTDLRALQGGAAAGAAAPAGAPAASPAPPVAEVQ